ncbi:hypothetical protein ABIA99_002128 [Bradyrhizobium sp. LB12.1]|uniref:hypothetical protein n=1 Tax=Bradyrhizobium sp. LB12.1 TaxID=3156327 RepID=UPI0033970757
MSLQSHWEEVLRLNEFDKLTEDDKKVLRNVYFTGAVAFYGQFMSPLTDQGELLAELKRFVDDNRAGIVDGAILPDDLQGPASGAPLSGRRRLNLRTTKDR